MTAYYPTRQQARNAADQLYPDRGKTDAGLAVLDYECPNPACTKNKKKKGVVVTTLTRRQIHVSWLASAAWQQWRYYADFEYRLDHHRHLHSLTGFPVRPDWGA